MNFQSAINKEIFIPCDERLLVAVEVQRRRRRRMSFLSLPRGDYATYICLSVTNKRPHQLLITKLKKFGDSFSFVRRTQWTVEQLRQVDGNNPNKDTPEFDLVFDNSIDQWVANSSADKCIFVQILHRACQSYWKRKEGISPRTEQLAKGEVSQQQLQVAPGPGDRTPPSLPSAQPAQVKSCVSLRRPEFVNCQAKLTRGGCSMNLAIYRCRALVNHMKSKVAAKKTSARRNIKATL